MSSRNPARQGSVSANGLYMKSGMHPPGRRDPGAGSARQDLRKPKLGKITFLLWM